MASYKTYVNDKIYYKIKALDYLKKGLFIIIFVLVANFIVAKSFKINLLETGWNNVLRMVGVYNSAIPNVEIESSGWNKKEPGSWHINKSAIWTGLGEAKITFEVDTTLKTNGKLKDVILVFDISGSMYGNPLEKVKEDAKNLVNIILSNVQNQVALITFDSKSEILSYLTNNKEMIINQIDSLNAYGMTNYNAALKNVDEVLKTYQEDKNRDLIVLFLTDGYPCEDTPNQIGTYQILKEKYSYSTINGIQYEMGSNITKELEEISDNQFYADIKSLENVLFESALNPESYENFEIVDYIEDEYFYVKDKNDIKVSIGTVSLEPEIGQDNQKITWNLGDNFKTRTHVKMEITLTLKDKYLNGNAQDYYPTNEKEEIRSKLKGEKQEEISSSLTPVLKGAAKVTYDTNPPSTCSSIKKITELKYHPSESVTIRNDEPICEGYNFKGWYIINEDLKDIKVLNEDVFIMPEHDVTIRAEWGKVTISKSIQGTIYEEKNYLYDVIKLEALSGSGLAIQYTGDTTGLGGGDQNIYYYRAWNEYSSSLNTLLEFIPNANIIFGDFCWIMVRTTQTGGVKLLYNGEPSNGTCNNDGNDQLIEIINEDGTVGSGNWNDKYILFNSNYNSLTDVGYMYGTRYETKQEYFEGTYAHSVKWNGTNYELIDTRTARFAWDRYQYTCGTSSDCSTVRYYHNIYYADEYDDENWYYYSRYYYIELSDGKTVEDALEEMLRRNDNDSTIKGYVDRWYEKYLKTDYGKYLEDTVFCNGRSIYEDTGWSPSGGGTDIKISFNPMYHDLGCPLETDQFSVGNNKAKLKYPIGLLTEAEARLAGNILMRSSGDWWLGTPYNYNYDSAYGNYVYSVGFIGSVGLNNINGIRPSISLKPGTEYSSGDGSKNDPYIILMKD